MASTALLPSQIVTELAAMASRGTYQVNPQQSQRMNALFTVVAELITEMERLENAQAEEDAQASQATLDFEDEGGA